MDNVIPGTAQQQEAQTVVATVDSHNLAAFGRRGRGAENLTMETDWMEEKRQRRKRSKAEVLPIVTTYKLDGGGKRYEPSTGSEVP
ncbi:hypothetical protein APHAL10511_008740 [Amanita phalloides]|nr:hypothetical protein APHAL10511_008740 [Amanita phalloides]